VTVAERAGQRLQIDRVVVLTFQTIRSNIVTLSALALIPAAPYAVLRYQSSLWVEGEALSMALMLPFAAAILSSYLLYAAISIALVPDHAGRLPSLGRCLAAIAKDFFPLVALATIASFVSAIANLALWIYEFGFILLVPALAIETLLAVIVPVRMIERTIARSIELTAGNRWPVLLLLLLSLALMMVSDVIVYETIGDPALVEYTGTGLAALLSLIVSDIVISVVASVATVIVYLEFRLIKEGVPPDAVAEVFD
jgi:hypothetical protein